MSLAKNGENFVLAQCVLYLLKSQNGQSEIEDELNEARKKLDSNMSDGWDIICMSQIEKSL